MPLSLGDCDRRFRQQHEAGERTRATRQPQTWRALAEWFQGEWQASMPYRLHVAGLEEDSSPRMAPAMLARIGHASDRGWGLTGWDRDGQPRGMTRDGEHTRQPFLHHLELRLLRREPDAQALMRWTYMGWDTEAAASNDFVRRIRMRELDPDGWESYLHGYAALLERGIRRLWWDCQSEPIRFSVCRVCRRRECVCAQRSESQVNAEGAT